MPQKRTRPGVVYRGVWYSLGNRGYFIASDGRSLLHRQVYRDSHGPIPDGYEVHHRDFDKTNNDPANLVALTPAEHRKAHGKRGGATDWDPETRGAIRRAAWARAEPRTVTCAWCGHPFQSIGVRATYCSGKHRDAARWARRKAATTLPGVTPR